MEKNMTYEQAYEELSQIAQQIETEEVSVDVLADHVKRASDLINFCQKKLRSTEGEVDNIIKKLDEQHL